MKSGPESLYRDIVRFTSGSAAGLLQVLVAASRRSTFQRIIACPTYPVPAKSSGLSLAVRHFREVMLCSDVNVPTFLARLYASVRTIADRKRSGQFFTSAAVAEWALSVARFDPGDHVCDAGAGTGAFADAILRKAGYVRSYVGVESDPILSLCAAHALDSLSAPESYKLWYANFLLLKPSDFRERGLAIPTVVIANPPFVRFHNLVGRVRIRAAVKSSLGIVLSPLCGSASYFISRAAELVGVPRSTVSESTKQRLFFFLPKEAAGAAHVQQLRENLHRMHGWAWRQVEIPRLQTEIDRRASNALALLCILEQQKVRVEPRQGESTPALRVGDILRVKRGISTGCNEFFVLSDEEVRRRKIPHRRLREVLPTRIPITRDQFLRADWDLLRASNRPCWLLALPDGEIEDFELSVQEYLKEGLRRGVHETPTARSLRTWFSIPVPPEPPDVFFTYMFRGAPRFVLNRARVFHLTNILGGRFALAVSDSKRHVAIIASLNTQAEHWIKDNMAGREYHGGLKKIEPRELSKLPIDPAILTLLDQKARAAVAVTSGSLFE